MAKHRSLRALLLGLALFAAACSGTEDVTATEAAESTDSTTAETAAVPADSEDAEAASADEGEGEAEAAEATADADDADDGGGEPSPAPAGGPPPSLPPEEARAAAEQNIPGLMTSDDVRDIEVVSVYDGSVTSLREVVTGDRPVLVWFWAPH